MEAIIWLSIALCVLQSGTFSGLNLAVFGVSTLELKAQSSAGSKSAADLLKLREDSNFLLTTILWGNVGTNVLLTLLSDSVLAGAVGFIFSTFVITLGGEIFPQAYFSRNALRMASALRPILRFWQFALFPIAKPTAMLLDAWLGREGFQFLREKELKHAIQEYTVAPESEMSLVEGIGMMNFMSLDDLRVNQEGEIIDPKSVIVLPSEHGLPVFPEFKQLPDDAFLRQIDASGQRWVLFVSPEDKPMVALDSDAFLRAAIFKPKHTNIWEHCHRPIVAKDSDTKLEDLIPMLRVEKENEHDDVIDHDLIVLWGEQKRIITGADLLGRLMRGITRTH